MNNNNPIPPETVQELLRNIPRDLLLQLLQTADTNPEDTTEHPTTPPSTQPASPTSTSPTNIATAQLEPPPTVPPMGIDNAATTPSTAIQHEEQPANPVIQREQQQQPTIAQMDHDVDRAAIHTATHSPAIPTSPNLKPPPVASLPAAKLKVSSSKFKRKEIHLSSDSSADDNASTEQPGPNDVIDVDAIANLKDDNANDAEEEEEEEELYTPDESNSDECSSDDEVVSPAKKPAVISAANRAMHRSAYLRIAHRPQPKKSQKTTSITVSPHKHALTKPVPRQMQLAAPQGSLELQIADNRVKRDLKDIPMTEFPSFTRILWIPRNTIIYVDKHDAIWPCYRCTEKEQNAELESNRSKLVHAMYCPYGRGYRRLSTALKSGKKKVEECESEKDKWSPLDIMTMTYWPKDYPTFSSDIPPQDMMESKFQWSKVGDYEDRQHGDDDREHADDLAAPIADDTEPAGEQENFASTRRDQPIVASPVNKRLSIQLFKKKDNSVAQTTPQSLPTSPTITRTIATRSTSKAVSKTAKTPSTPPTSQKGSANQATPTSPPRKKPKLLPALSSSFHKSIPLQVTTDLATFTTNLMTEGYIKHYIDKVYRCIMFADKLAEQVGKPPRMTWLDNISREPDNHLFAYRLLFVLICSKRAKDTSLKMLDDIVNAPQFSVQYIREMSLPDLAKLITPIGLQQKNARDIQRAFWHLSVKHNLHMPQTLQEICEVDGVGSKIGSLVLYHAFGINTVRGG